MTNQMPPGILFCLMCPGCQSPFGDGFFRKAAEVSDTNPAGPTEILDSLAVTEKSLEKITVGDDGTCARMRVCCRRQLIIIYIIIII